MFSIFFRTFDRIFGFANQEPPKTRHILQAHSPVDFPPRMRAGALGVPHEKRSSGEIMGLKRGADDVGRTAVFVEETGDGSPWQRYDGLMEISMEISMEILMNYDIIDIIPWRYNTRWRLIPNFDFWWIGLYLDGLSNHFIASGPHLVCGSQAWLVPVDPWLIRYTIGGFLNWGYPQII